MLLRQNDNNSQWSIVVFYPSSHVSTVFLPLYLDKDQGPSIVSTWYPNAVTSCWVPPSFREIMSTLKKKLISCHHCHTIILNSAGTMALKDGIHVLSEKFRTEEDAKKHFIVLVIDTYLVRALDEFKNNKRKASRLKQKVLVAKHKWDVAREGRQQREAYLGSQPFHYDLRRSCEEFYSILKKEWGFSPEKQMLMK